MSILDADALALRYRQAYQDKFDQNKKKLEAQKEIRERGGMDIPTALGNIFSGYTFKSGS